MWFSQKAIRDISKFRRILAAVALVLLAVAVSHSAAFAETDDTRSLIRKAAKLTRAGKFVEAEEVLRSAAASAAKPSEVNVELAYVLTKQRRLGEAYELVFPVARDEPKNARAYAVLGMTMLSGGRFREARGLFYSSIRVDQRSHLAWAGYGLLDFYENRIGDAIANLQEAVFHSPREPDYLFSLAQVSARAERYTEAADAYKDFLAVSGSADVDRRERIRGLINFLRYLGQAGRLYSAAGRDETTVPFELVGNRPVIPLRINGRDEPLKFVLDTGSGISVISDETAKRLKIKPVTRGGFARGLGGNGRFEIVYGLLREVEIGDVALKQVPVYIRKFHSDGPKADGYIGLALISKFLTTIDYGSKSFALTRREEDRREFADTDLTLPLRLTSSGFLSGEVLVEGVETPLNFIVDTGASVSVISSDMTAQDPIRGFANDERLRVIGSAGIANDVQTFTLPKVTFGKHSRRDITAVALDLDLINEASGFEQAGILGGNFLKNYRLTFDFRRSRVSFTSVTAEPE